MSLAERVLIVSDTVLSTRVINDTSGSGLALRVIGVLGSPLARRVSIVADGTNAERVYFISGGPNPPISAGRYFDDSYFGPRYFAKRYFG